MPARAGVPTPFVATHSILPAIFRSLTSTNRRRLFSKLTLLDIPLCCQLIIGCGTPLAVQTISNTEPSLVSSLPLGEDITFGGSIKLVFGIYTLWNINHQNKFNYH